MERLKIFISGTQDDLQPERKAVADAIRVLGHEPLMAETYGAQPMPSLSAIREMIEQADIYVGVYGAHYGWKMDSGVSVTEFEFIEFRRQHSDRILTYIKEIQLEPEQEMFLRRVQDFKEGYFRRPKFTDARQLAGWVKDDLAQFIARVVHEKLRGTPDPALIRIYLRHLAAQKIPTLWDDALYLDRAVAPSADLFARTVARYDPRTPERDAKTEPEPLQAALAREKKLVLLGEPGLGKTTSLHALARETAQQAQGEIPIYAELKYYDGGELETLLAQSVNKVLAASQRMLAPDLTESTRVLKQWLAQSNARFLLFLDGLNEVRPEHHTAIRNALDTLLRFPHPLIVSCRERDYDASLRDHTTAFVLQPLQGDEIREYLQRALGDKGVKLFDDQIRWDEKMRTLAGNPLMLWLITLVAQNDLKARLPKNRGKLFQQFVALMPRLRMSDGVHTEIPPDVVETALAKLGFEMQERGLLTVDLRKVRDWQIPTASKNLEDVLAQAKDWRLLKSDGRLGEPIEFLHQLFLEYFAAVYLKTEIGDSKFEVLGERPFDARWNETIVMLAGISDQPMELVEWLGKKVVKQKKGHAAFLVKQCWETSKPTEDVAACGVVVDALGIALRDRKPDMRWDARDALVQIGTPAVEPLMAALCDKNADVRMHAVVALGKISDTRAIEPLIVALCDNNGDVRMHAADALGKIKDTRAVEPLIAAMSDKDADVRESVIDALVQIGDARAVESLLVALHQGNPRLRRIVADVLGQIGVPAVESLIAALRDADRYVHRRAAEVLGEIGDSRAVAPLIVALRDTDRSMHSCAARALMRIGTPSVEPLVGVLRDGDENVRWHAAWALGEIGDVRALAKLERVAREDKSKAKRGTSVAYAARRAAKEIRKRMKSTDGNG